MNQVSRPVQILLGVVLVFAVLWFTVLKPGEPAIEPVPAATTAAPVDAGGTTAQSGPGKAVEAANNAAQAANAAAGAAGGATTPSGTTPGGAAAASGATSGGTVTPTSPAGKESSGRSASQRKADRVIESIGADLKAKRAVVVLVYQPGESVDEVLENRVRKQIDRRNGKVRIYLIRASQVGRYDGLFRDLSLAQTPSTVVIAPDNSAKVLGGLVSTARIDRLTSAALLTAR